MLVELMVPRAWSRDVVRVAVEALEAGHDSPSMRILGWLSEQEPRPNAFEVEAYAKRAVEELGYSIPNASTLVTERRGALARGVVSGEVTAEAGCELLGRLR